MRPAGVVVLKHAGCQDGPHITALKLPANLKCALREQKKKQHKRQQKMCQAVVAGMQKLTSNQTLPFRRPPLFRTHECIINT